MSRPEQSDILSKVTVRNRGPMLQIFRPDQAYLPEENQRPSIVVELDGEAAQCLWVSTEPVDEAKAKVSRIIGRKRGSLDWQPYAVGFRVGIDNAWIAYEGAHGQSWLPRFSCTIEQGSLSIQPLSQLIASTAVERGFGQRTVEKLISDFMQNHRRLTA